MARKVRQACLELVTKHPIQRCRKNLARDTWSKNMNRSRVLKKTSWSSATSKSTELKRVEEEPTEPTVESDVRNNEKEMID